MYLLTEFKHVSAQKIHRPRTAKKQIKHIKQARANQPARRTPPMHSTGPRWSTTCRAHNKQSKPTQRRARGHTARTKRGRRVCAQGRGSRAPEQGNQTPPHARLRPIGPIYGRAAAACMHSTASRSPRGCRHAVGMMRHARMLCMHRIAAHCMRAAHVRSSERPPRGCRRSPCSTRARSSWKSSCAAH